jgi:hypothetical protein
MFEMKIPHGYTNCKNSICEEKRSMGRANFKNGPVWVCGSQISGLLQIPIVDYFTQKIDCSNFGKKNVYYRQ